MGNCVFGFPIHSDDSVLQTPAYSGGSWQAALPLTNLKDRRLSKVARSTNAALSSTRFRVNLGKDRSWRVVALPKTNFSPTAKWRVLSTVAPLLFRYEAGDDISLMGGTFTRATTAVYFDRHGIARTAASGELRDSHFLNGKRYVLIEPARTNSIWPSRNLTTNWTGAAGVAANAVGLDGTPNSATTITDDDPAAFENRTRNITVVPNDSATHAGQIWIRKDNDETRFPQIGFGLTGGTTTVSRNIVLNTKTGEFVNANATGTGTATVRESPGGLWWIVDITVDNNSTGNVAMTCTLFPSTRSAFPGSDSVAAVGSIVVGHVQIELNTTFCTSPIFTTTATVTRNVDLLSFAIAFNPQVLSMYSAGVDVGAGRQPTGQFAITNMATLGRNGAGDYDLSNRLNANGVDRRAQARLGSVGSVPSQAIGDVTSGGTLVFGGTMELVSRIYSDGKIDVQQSIDGAAVVTGALSVDAVPLEATWGANTVEIGGYGSTVGGWAVSSVRIMAGLQSMETMRDSVHDSGWLDGYPAGEDAETLDGINVPLVHVPAAAKTSQILDFQIDDSLNPAGFVDVARLIVAGGWQPTVNMAPGANLGLDDESVRELSDGGAAIYQRKPVARTKKLVLDIPRDEAFANAWRMQRRLGKTGQLFFVTDPDDVALMHERSFLAVMRELNGLDYPYPLDNQVAIELIEDL